MAAGCEGQSGRSRPPRMRIVYDVEEADGGIELRELPFVVGVLADLAGRPESLWPHFRDRKFVQIDSGNFDQAMAAFAPRLAFEVDSRRIELRFRRLADFEPPAVIRQVEALRELAEAGSGSLSAQLDGILHAPEFQKLEATWRGLHYLVSETATSPAIKIKVLNLSKRELQDDLAEAAEFDQSILFSKVYEEVYGDRGTAPYAVLVGDYEFGPSAEDIGMLETMSQVARTAHAPFIAAASPRMFGWDDFTGLAASRGLAAAWDLDMIIGTEAYNGWRSFRRSFAADHVCLVLPRILLRLPYGEQTSAVGPFPYEEDAGDGHLWGNPAWALTARLTDSFRVHGSCAAICGVEGGGTVTGLPLQPVWDVTGTAKVNSPTDVMLDDIQEHALSANGFACLCGCPNDGLAVFFSVPTCAQQRRFEHEAATAFARLSVQLPYVLAVSRFAHYLKAMVRDRTGGPMTNEDCERFLNSWICQYVVLDDDAIPEVKARFPLRAAHVVVSGVPGHPGRQIAVAFLRPHFLLSDPGQQMRVVAELPPATPGA